MNDDEELDERAQTEKRVRKLFDDKKAKGEPTGPTSLVKEAGISRGYFYTFTELAAEVSAYAKKTQPKVSRRGAGVTRLEAKKRAIDDQVRREHTRWSKEVPKLKQQLKESEDDKNKLVGEKEVIASKYERLQRAYELLLMLAHEAGASPTELEALQQKLSKEVARRTGSGKPRS
jgi:chromosome segregation ATPase